MTDQEILQLIKEDNPRIITQVYKKYHDEFIRFVRKAYPRIGIDNAEDAYSDSFQALTRNIKIGKLVTLTCSIKTYIFQIGKYKIIDEINRKRRIEGQDIIEYWPTEEINLLDFFENDDEKVKKNLLMSDAVSKLTEPCKTLLILFWYEEKSDKEIVETTGYTSTDTVKNQRSRCMKMLRTKCN